MAGKVYITGYGIISALGIGIEQTLSALKTEKSGIALPAYLNTIYKNQKVVGEVKYSNQRLKEQLGLQNDVIMSRTALLALIAVREAIERAGLGKIDLTQCSLSNGTSVGGMDISEDYYQAHLDGGDLPYKQAFGGHECSYSTELIADYFGIHGHLSTISTACSSSANTIMQAGRLIKSGKVDIAIAGGTDALSKFTLNGFNSLKIIDDTPCKPFDENRAGLNLGEGAAYLVLESEKSVERRGSKVIAQLVGYGNANDAYHQTASSPDGRGATLAIKDAFKIAGDSLQIDYINAHGTGTHNNDLSESIALQNIFGESIPNYSSTKAFTGHTLGAAGAIEAVFSILAIEHNLQFPSLNIVNAMSVNKKKPLAKILKGVHVKNVLSNSFGFGGNCTSLIFSE